MKTMKNDIKSKLSAWLNFDLDLDEVPERTPPKQKEPHRSKLLILRRIQNERAHRAVYALLAVFCSITLAACLLLTVSGMPRYGEDAEFMDTVTYEYLAHGMEYTGVVNIVSGIILEYRAFDTLGESFVLFCAVSCVLLLLRRDGAPGKEPPAMRDITGDPILSSSARILVPLIFVFGIYVLLNGHLSPGGGFSGGAVLGAGLIIISSAFGEDVSGRIITERVFKTVTTAALLFYCVGKSYTFFTGANGLPTGIGNGTPGDILSAGLILPLNIAVGMVVACTVYGMYRMFGKGRF